MSKYMKALPAKLCQAWLAKLITKYKAEQKWDAYMVSIGPYMKPADFDLENPKVSDLPRVDAFKWLLFRTELIRETLTEMMFQGEGRVFAVQLLCKSALAYFENVVELDLDEAGASDLRSAELSVTAVSCVAHIAVSAKCLD